MPFFEVIKWLLDVATSILNKSTKLKEQRREDRLRVAACLDSIVSCLDNIVRHARANEWSSLVGRCEELAVYLENFNRLEGIPELIGADQAGLSNRLADAVKARRGLVLATTLSTGKQANEVKISEVERAAGTFRAASTLIRSSDL